MNLQVLAKRKQLWSLSLTNPGGSTTVVLPVVEKSYQLSENIYLVIFCAISSAEQHS